MTTTIKVQAIRFFKGEPNEGQDGLVAPGDVLTITKERAAALRSNGLIGDEVDASYVPPRGRPRKR